MIFRRRPERDSEQLPDRDASAAAHEAAASDDLGASADHPTALVIDVRPPFREIARRWLATIGAVGLVVGALYLLGTPDGRSVVDARGLLAASGGWVLFLVLVAAGAAAGLGVSRAVSAGQRRLDRGGVVRHAVGESLAAGVGATAVAMIGAFAWPDVMRILAFTLALTTIFTWSVLMPASLARFTEHATS